MRIPNKVRILGQNFEVIKSAKSPAWASKISAGRGAFSTGKKTRIWIDTDYSVERQSECLFHEIFEIICELMVVRTYDGYDEKEGFEPPLFYFDHNKFRDISLVLWATLRDNKLL